MGNYDGVAFKVGARRAQRRNNDKWNKFKSFPPKQRLESRDNGFNEPYRLRAAGVAEPGPERGHKGP